MRRPILLATALVASCLVLPALAQSGHADLDDQFARVERELDRTRDILDQVGPMVGESNVPRAKELFAVAISQQIKSRLLFQRAQESADRPTLASQLLREALSLTLQARGLGQRAGNLLREQVGFEERARRAIEQLERRIEQARDRDLGSDSRSAALLAEASQQLDSARTHFADHNFEVAYRIAESGLRLLNGIAGGDGMGAQGEERFLRQLQRTEQLLERAGEHRDDLDPAGERLLAQASNLLEEAKQAARAQDMRRAQSNLDEAQRLLRQLLDHVDVDTSDVNRAFERFDAALAQLQQDDSAASSEDVQRLVQRAIDERREAQAALERGENDRALTRLRGAMDLLDRARRLARTN